MIAPARVKDVMVFGVKTLSFKRTHVNIAKTILPTPKPISLDVQREPETPTIFLIAYQNIRPTGIAKMAADVNGLFAHHPHTN